MAKLLSYHNAAAITGFCFVEASRNTVDWSRGWEKRGSRATVEIMKKKGESVQAVGCRLEEGVSGDKRHHRCL